MTHYGKVQETDKGKHLKSTTYTNTLFSTTTKTNAENMIVIYKALIFLDLNYKHTSIFQQHISPTYNVPLNCYSSLLLEMYLLCQEFQSDIQDRAALFMSDPRFFISLYISLH